MSYSCYISFKEVSSANLYDFLLNIKHLLIDNIKEVAKLDCMYSPSVQYLHKKYIDMDIRDKSVCQDWAYNCFKYRYFYISKYNLLGVFGVPDCVENLFDDTIYFQNSTDQDYDLDEWSSIKLFKKLLTNGEKLNLVKLPNF